LAAHYLNLGLKPGDRMALKKLAEASLTPPVNA